MRKTTSAISVAAMLALSSVAAAQTTHHYRGSFCVIVAGQGCPAQNLAVGDCAKARYMPPNYGTGAPDLTRMTVIWNYSAVNLSSAGSIYGNVWKDTSKSLVTDGLTQENIRWKEVLQQPLDLDLFPWLHIVGDVDNFKPGCYVRYRFLGQRWPNSIPALGQGDEDQSGFGNLAPSFAE